MKLPIKVGISPILKIRAILASKDLKKGQIIERCPVVLVDIKAEKHLEGTSLSNYYFEWNSKFNAVALGYGSLINHSYEPNARFDCNFRKKTVVFKAIRDIKKGEEIFTNYNGEPKNSEKVDAGYLKPDKKYNSIVK